MTLRFPRGRRAKPTHIQRTAQGTGLRDGSPDKEEAVALDPIDTRSSRNEERSRAQDSARIVGVVFLLIGSLGFIPGITQHYGDMKFLGHSSDAELLGILQVSVLHNIVHLLFGVAGLVL